jgi:DNA-binding CsgD family transcriptional regulator/DNA-binding transcriptional ArsR family regulator
MVTSDDRELATGIGIPTLLEPLGFDTTADIVYRALLNRPDLDPCGLAAHLELSKDQVDRALDVLAEHALLTTRGEFQDQWVPKDPELRLGAIVAAEEVEINRRWQSIQKARSYISELASIYRQADGFEDTPDVERVVGLETVRHRLAALASGAQREVRALIPGGPQAADVMEGSRALDQESLNRGLRMRTVFLDSMRNGQATMNYARWLVKLGGQVRTVPALPCRMIIVDHSLAVVPFDPAAPRQGALIVSNPGMVSVCEMLFVNVWQGAAPLTDAPPARSGEGRPGAQELELLRLLDAGHTDDFAARQLGVSLRTVRRMTSMLMRRLGTSSRFQLGVRAERLGWLSTAD